MSRYVKAFPLSATSSGNVVATASCGGGANGVLSISATGSTQTQAILSEIIWSYSTTPASGGLNIYDGTSSGAVMLAIDVTAQGPDALVLGLKGSPGNRVTVEMLQAGSSIIGKLNAYGYTD